jgi:CheY-like chemotaxis protein
MKTGRIADQMANAGGRRPGPVLLVENDRDIRQAMTELLEDEGYECIVAEHGHAALDVLSRQMPSLLLIDLLMPIMNGVELITRLRRDPRWSDLPMVVMTAAGDRIIGVDVESLNVPVLRKPVEIGSLVQVLARQSDAAVERREACQ